jgi:hypothetical protein
MTHLMSISAAVVKGAPAMARAIDGLIGLQIQANVNPSSRLEWHRRRLPPYWDAQAGQTWGLRAEVGVVVCRDGSTATARGGQVALACCAHEPEKRGGRSGSQR